MYDNVTGRQIPKTKKPGVDGDIYGAIEGNKEGIYDNGAGGKGMNFSDDGLYDNTGGRGEFICSSQFLFVFTIYDYYYIFSILQ